MEVSLSAQDLELKVLELLNDFGLPRVEIPANRRYWFIRTQAGTMFEEFWSDQFVAIGWDKAPCFKPDEYFTDQALEQVEHKFEVKSGTRILNQVRRFCYEMKPGDAVVIPSKSSAVLAFGIVTGDIYYVDPPSEEDVEEGFCPYTRRRKVRWLTDLSRQRIDAKLYEIFRSHHAISSADDYAPFIDRVMSPFYIKDGITHLTLPLGADESPYSEDITTLIGGLNFYSKQIMSAYGLEESEFLRMRINVQSRGNFELFGRGTKILLVGLTVLFLCGGEFTGGFSITKMEANVSAKTGGLPHLLDTVSRVVRELPSDHPFNITAMKDASKRTELGRTKEETVAESVQDSTTADNDSYKPGAKETQANDY